MKVERGQALLLSTRITRRSGSARFGVQFVYFGIAVYDVRVPWAVSLKFFDHSPRFAAGVSFRIFYLYMSVVYLDGTFQ